ncbi:hypothetical protein HF850_00325 [Clostridium sp. SM-530-WT-3G]|nr:hypothetical protein [Clostridium sp. SM-530-WT-3G]
MRKVELLIPAGNLENLKIAIAYGADAVFLGGEAFSLRANAANFSMKELREGIEKFTSINFSTSSLLIILKCYFQQFCLQLL